MRTLEEKYQVSKSSIVNDLEYVDRSLQKNELFLKEIRVGLYVNGKEQHIRSAKGIMYLNNLNRKFLLRKAMICRPVKNTSLLCT